VNKNDHYYTPSLKRIKISYSISKLFDPPVKINGELGEMSR